MAADFEMLNYPDFDTAKDFDNRVAIDNRVSAIAAVHEAAPRAVAAVVALH